MTSSTSSRQSLAGYGVVKVFFQPNVNINSALAQITAASQTVLKLLPQGITPPYVLSFNASSVPILQLALSSDAMSQAEIFDAGQNFIRPQLATVAGTAIPSPYGGKVLQVQVDLNQDKLQAYGLSSQDVVEAIARQNVITPVGTQKIGKFEYVVALNDAPKAISELNDLPIREVNGSSGLHPRRRLRPRGQPAADQHGAGRRLKRGLDDHPEDRLGLDARRHRRGQGAVAETAPDVAAQSSAGSGRRPVEVCERCGVFGHLRGRGGCGADGSHDPDLPRQLAFDPHHYGFDPARDSRLGRAPRRDRARRSMS